MYRFRFLLSSEGLTLVDRIIDSGPKQGQLVAEDISMMAWTAACLHSLLLEAESSYIVERGHSPMRDCVHGRSMPCTQSGCCSFSGIHYAVAHCTHCIPI